MLPLPRMQDYERRVATSDISRSINPGGDGLLSYCHWRCNLTITSPDHDPSHPQHGHRFGSVGVADITKAASGMLPVRRGSKDNVVDEKIADPGAAGEAEVRCDQPHVAEDVCGAAAHA
jgi:hypothetical protein